MNNLVKVSVPVNQHDKQLAISNTNQSGTGVYYQAMPAVGPDGKNVMKLIPVQRVNGQFVRTQNNCNLLGTYKTFDSEPQRVYAQPIHFTPSPVSPSNLPVLHPAVNARYVLKKPSDINLTLNPVNSAGKLSERMNVSTSAPIRVHVPIVPSKVTQNVMPVASPVLNCGKTITLLNKNQLPVAVKSPALPEGHYLQIPPNAQVKTLPASALPQAIKNRILTSPVSTYSGVTSTTTSLPTVVYVSPVNAMKLGTPVQAPSVSSAPHPINPSPKICSQPPAPSPATLIDQSQKVFSKESQGPVTPIKWVVQEQSDSAGPCLVPQNSSAMTTEILKALAKMEKGNNVGQSMASKPSLQDSQSAASQGKDNALVMCNGKMYFVAKKTVEFEGYPTSAQKGNERIGNQYRYTAGTGRVCQRITSVSQIQPSSTVPGSDVLKGSSQNISHLNVTNRVDEIIDLCDDDLQDDCVGQKKVDYNMLQPSSNKVIAVEDDDSNVIFVSYIPPKSCTQSASHESENGMLKESAPEKEVETTQENEVGQKIGTVQENKLCQDTDMKTDQKEEIETGQETKVRQEAELEICQQEAEMVVEPVSDEAGVTSQENEIHKELQNNQSKEPADQEEATPQLQATSVMHALVSEKMREPDSDGQLRRRFGITADIRICLRSIPSAESKATPKKVPQIGSINKRTLDAIRRLIQSSRIEMKTKKLTETQVLSPKRKNEDSMTNVKRRKVEQHENNSRAVESTPDKPSAPMELSESTETTEECRENPVGQALHTQSEVATTFVEGEPSCSSLEDPASLEGVEQEQDTGGDVGKEGRSPAQLNSSLQSKAGTASSRATAPPKSRKGKGRQNKRQANLAIKPPVPDRTEICSSDVAGEECGLMNTPSSRDKKDMAMESMVEPQQALEGAIPAVATGGDKEPASVEIRCPSTSTEPSCNFNGELAGGDIFSAAPMDPEEIKRHEKIKRLKELLKEKEAALELIRKNML